MSWGAAHEALPWLPRPPADLAARFAAAAAAADGDAGDIIRAISGFALNDNQLRRLSGVIDALRARAVALDPLRAVKLGVAGSSTMDFAVSALQGTSPRHGMRLECIDGGFGQAMQCALDPGCALQKAKPHFVLIALDDRWLAAIARTAGPDAPEKALEAVRQMLAGFRAGCGATCLVQTIPRPVESLFGSLDRSVPSSARAVFERFNRGLVEVARENAALIVDVAALAENIGLSGWHDAALWNCAKIAFSQEHTPAYAEWVCRVVAAALGRSRKCLVLDLDNTLWSGVLGDDGIDGIGVGTGDAAAEAHLDLQRLALDLRGRGIVLAVCSKNDDALARRALRECAGMLLREDHFAVLQANWSDKATNLKAIAAHIGLGLDALVFVDDNPAERALVRAALPEVAVPELPGDPALYAATLAAAGYFESVSFSAEDLQRADAYAANAQRLALRDTVGNLDDYLRSLQMQIRFAAFEEPSRARIAQLINKSNQYNLTTRRYTEAQVAQLAADPACETLQVRLADVFGDNGMISVVICRLEGDAWEIDTWLMSCRVLGRRVEEAVLAALVEKARRRGVRRLVGVYIASGRNALVEDHYRRLGFAPIDADAGETSRWELLVADYESRHLPITVRAG